MAEILASGNAVADIRRTINGEAKRWRLSLRTSKAREANARKAILHQLARSGETWVLDALAGGALSIESVVEALSPKGKGLESLRPRSKGVTLAEACVSYQERRGKRASTRDAIKRVSKQLQAKFGADILVSKVDRAGARAWLYKSKWTPKTQTVKHTYAQAIFEEAIKLEREKAKHSLARVTIEENVWHEVKPEKVERKEVEFLAFPQVQALLDSVERHSLKHATFMALGFLGALRVTEALNLRWHEDVNLDAHELYVQPRAGKYAWKPKNKRGTRTVEIPERLVELLGRWRENVRGAYVWGERPPARRTGATWSAKAFEWHGMVAGRQNEGWTYHSGRHSAISNALRGGIPISIVAQWAGDTEKTIMDTYSHVLRGDARAVANLFNGQGTP